MHDYAIKIGKNASNRLAWKVRNIRYFSSAQQECIFDTKIGEKHCATLCEMGLTVQEILIFSIFWGLCPKIPISPTSEDSIFQKYKLIYYLQPKWYPKSCETKKLVRVPNPNISDDNNHNVNRKCHHATRKMISKS